MMITMKKIMKKIPEGYKKTEIGIIPEDWDVCELRDLTKMITNGFVGTATTHYTEADDGVTYIQGYNVIENSFNFTGIKKVTLAFHQQHQKSCLKEGDLLTVQTGDVGLTTIVPKRLEGCNCHALIIYRFKKVKVFPYFYSYYFNSSIGRSRLKEFETGSTMKHLNISDMVHWKVPFPKFKEQTAIATVLSDTDALIERLGKLIAKKKAIKQGAMQQLLTGKKRLPGFSGEWEVKKLPEVVWFQEGPGVRNSQFTNSGVKLLNGTNIEDGKLLLEKTDRYISEKEAFGWYSHFLVDDGDILIACSGVTIDKFQEKVTIASQVNLPLCMNTSTMRFKIVSSILSKDFFFYFLKSKSFKEQIGGKATGSAQLNFGPS
ncbi:MAG TPA: hypothetical protein HA348_02215, partial [Thermoplasmata archaeon]|nr:hypothetical protein [Thermoplasmata archaeon]